MSSTFDGIDRVGQRDGEWVAVRDTLRKVAEASRVDGESTATFPTGAVRSADAEDCDWISLPWLGVLSVARTAREGAAKYGEFNYLNGFPARVLLGHAVRHIVMYLLGDRSEPHLSHAAWNLLVAEQQQVTHPELMEGQTPGPGYVLTDALRAELAAGAEERKRKRESGAFASLANWTLGRLPDVVKLLRGRA